MTVTAPAPPQRWVTQVQAASDARGNVTLVLGPPPLGFAWTGEVSVSNAPVNGSFTADTYVKRGTWSGSTPFGPIQLMPGESLTVTGTGLAATTVYTLQFEGSVEDASTVAPVSPQPATPAAQLTTLVLSNPAVVVGVSGVVQVGSAINCTSWTSIAVQAASVVGQYFQVQVNWFSDATLALMVGRKTFMVDGSLQANLTVPNMGAFATVVVTASSLGGVTVALNISLTNVAVPEWNPVVVAPMVDVQGQSVNGGGTVFTFSENFMYAGPASLYFATNAASFLLSISGIDIAARAHEFVSIDQASNGSAKRFIYPIVVPPMVIHGTVTNNDGAPRSFTVAVVPDVWH